LSCEDQQFSQLLQQQQQQQQLAGIHSLLGLSAAEPSCRPAQPPATAATAAAPSSAELAAAVLALAAGGIPALELLAAWTAAQAQQDSREFTPGHADVP
jgi:hypothetical protein